MDNFYRGKSVLLTGASSGIGEAMAHELAAHGADLLLVARRTDRLRLLAAEVKQAHPDRRVEVLTADLSLEGASEKLYAECLRLRWQVDVLINNAGVGYKGLFHKGELARQQSMLRLNVDAVMELTHLFLPSMLEKGRGGILNVASVAALQSTPYFAAYAATKAFVLNFTEALWKEYRGSGVHFSALCPGPVETEFFEAAGIDTTSIYRPGLQDAITVARAGLQGLAQDQSLQLTSPLFGAMAFMTKVLPRKAILEIGARVMQRQLRDAGIKV